MTLLSSCRATLSDEDDTIRHGRWQDVLQDTTCDALIFDAPHSEQSPDRTHRPELHATDYDALTPADVRKVCESWAPRTTGWWVSITDYPLSHLWIDEMRRVGRYVFGAPVPLVIRAMSVRAQADGPSSWALYAVVSRPATREFADWGALPGAYVGGTEGHGRAGGTDRSGGRGKPQWMMCALVRDYTRPNDLVCDPFAGYGATGMAALGLGRRFVGAEMDGDACAEARRRLARPLQIDMFGGDE